MKIYIRNMVCPRCIEAVATILSELKLAYRNIRLGEVELLEPVDEHIKIILKEKLVSRGFDLLEDKKSKIVEKVKNLVLNYINQVDDNKIKKLSDYLAEHIGFEYSHISGTFKENQGVTIERYVILQKIEKVKELLSYDELNLNEIADHLNYSSSAALSSQFKEVTGMTPTEFKKNRDSKRNFLDAI